MLRWKVCALLALLGVGVLGFLGGVPGGGVLWGDILTDSGNIYFDANADNAREVALNGKNLGIGTTTPSTNLHVLGNAYISSNLGIGTANPLSSLEVSGTLGLSVQSVSANTTLSGNTIVLADTSSANLTLTLPYSGNAFGRMYTIKKVTNSNELVVVATGNVDGVYDSLSLSSGNTSYPFASVVSGNTSWSITSISTYSLPHLSANLIGWWRLDETSGTKALDSSAGNQQGTTSGSPTWNSTSGKIKGMLACPTSSDNMSLGNHSKFYFGSGNFTVAFWVRKNANSSGWTNWRGVTKWYDNSTTSMDEWSVDLADSATGGTNKPEFESYFNSTSRVATATNALTIGQWAHLAGVRDGTSIRLYMNGKQEAVTGTLAASDALTNTGRPIVISASGSQATGSNADYDDLRIYNRALSTAEILALYSLGQ